MIAKKYSHKVNYLASDGVIEIIIKDPTGKKEAKFVANQSDSSRLREIGSILKAKYGIDLTPSEKDGFFDY